MKNCRLSASFLQGIVPGPGDTMLYETGACPQVACSLSDSTLPSCSHCSLSTYRCKLYADLYIYFYMSVSPTKLISSEQEQTVLIS